MRQRSAEALLRYAALGELHVVDGNSTKGVAMLWWRNLGASCKGLIFKIKGLPSIDGWKTGAIHNHIAGRCNEITVVLLRTWHAKTFVWCQQRSLHLVHTG